MNELSELCRRLVGSKRILLVTHARPDGDGLGSMAAMYCWATAAGKTADLLVPDAVPQRYAFLFPDRQPASSADFAAQAERADLIVILDTCAFSQLDGLANTLPLHRSKIVVLDHHATADDIGSLQWVDSKAAAAGVMTAELLDALGWKGNARSAEALAVAITSDTGWLRFANTDGRCLRAMAKLMEAGIRPDQLYARLFQSDREERIRLMARMLSGMELRCGNRLAVLTIAQADFTATGALPEETENLINEALRIGSVDTSVLLVENNGGLRVSLRSRDAVDVAAVARLFGGGGHVRAAGFRSDQPLEAIKARLISAVESQLASR